jgi:hypothetical protein
MISYLLLIDIAFLRVWRTRTIVRSIDIRRLFGFGLSGKAIRSYDAAYLFDLIRLGLPTAWLQVENFGDSFASENVVIATNSFCKSQVPEQASQVVESDVGVRIASENAIQSLGDFAHDSSSDVLCKARR